VRRSTPSAAFALVGTLVCTLVWALLLAAPGFAGDLGTCGDGVVDAGEDCDQGPDNSDSGCCSSACQLVDWDFDGLCDGLDPCVTSETPFAERVRLVGRRFGDGLQRMRVEAVAALGSGTPLDPSRDGVHVLLARLPDRALLAADLPPGDGWRGGGARWRWTASGAESHGVDELRVVVGGDGRARVSATLVVEAAAATAPLRFAVRFGVAGAPGDGPPRAPAVACLEARFPATRCRAGADGALRCGEAPRFPVCRKPGHAARLECGVLRIAAAQERHYDTARSYQSDCDALPGFRQPAASVASCAGSMTEHRAYAATALLPDVACCAAASEHALVVECGASPRCPSGAFFAR